MAGHQEHVRAGILFYGGFLVVGAALTLVPETFPFVTSVEWMNYLIPQGGGWETLIGIAICFVIAILGALWPDVDIKSVGQVIFYRLFVVLDVVLIGLYFVEGRVPYLEGSAFLGLAAMLPLIGKHRGWTHSRLTMLGLPALIVLGPMFQAVEVTWVGLPYAIAAFLGYASHLFKDGILFRR